LALRLIDSVEPAPDARPVSVRLFERGAELLARGDLAAWAELFAEAAGVGDVHERYRARRSLLAGALSACGTLPIASVPKTLVSVARCALGVLDEEPREPVILNQCGVALYELGSLDAAEACFRVALALAPELPDVAANLEQLAARRRRRLKPLPLGRSVELSVPRLAERAKAIARRARPREDLRLSLCMIVKDEEEMLPQCLAAVSAAVDEIVIVDTGSSDRTVEIARQHAARVIEMDWTGSFADARNASFDAATGDWLMYLDADEVLVAEDVERLRALTGQTWREAIYLVETNHTGDLEDGTAVTHNALRLFRNRPEYRFEGRVHEQIAHRLPGDLPERFWISGVRVEHFGYLGEVRESKAKSSRNIELLQRQLAEGTDTPFLHFNLGSEYAAVGDGAAALAEFQLAWAGICERPDILAHGYVPSLVGRLVKALRTEGRVDEAEARADEGLELFEGFTDLVFEKALCARMRGDRDRAAALLRRCLEMGDAPSRYSSTVGCGTYVATVALAELCPAAEAVELLERSLEAHPRYLGAVLPLASALLGSGATPGSSRPFPGRARASTS
jgi:tetratricopeptide (TPR) repeat protein